MTVKSYRDLKVWQMAIDIVGEIYRLTENFPKQEGFGLTSHLQRAAVSIPSNIAEGHARGSDRELAHFLAIARGSLAEVETQLIIAGRLTYLDHCGTVEPLLVRLDTLGKMM